MEWMNYHHLRYFWAVASEGSLAAAAAKLGVSQPSISAQIRELETMLGQRLFKREGRKNVLTDAGQMVQHYASEIFSLGSELLNALNERPSERALRIHIGIVDSFPKVLGNELIRPLFKFGRPIHIICREGKPEDLLAQLAAHRLDLVLMDEPPPSSANLRVYDHQLGSTGSVFCATHNLAKKLTHNFPHSLDDQPALFPVENSPLRRSAETWLRLHNVKPRIVAEFDDPALMKVMAAEGHGFIILPASSATTVLKRYKLHIFGHTEDCRTQFHAITAERRIQHPALTAIINNKTWLPPDTN